MVISPYPTEEGFMRYTLFFDEKSKDYPAQKLPI